MELFCFAGNERALAFYRKAGMRQAEDVDQVIFGTVYPARRFVYDN